MGLIMTKLYKSLRLIALTLFSALSLHGAQPAPTTASSIEESQTTAEERAKIEQIVEAHIDEVLEKLGIPTEFPWLTGYYLKGDSSRVACAQTLLDYIKKNDLKFVTVPEKWLHPHQIDMKRRAKMPVHSLYKDDPYIVIAKKLDGNHFGTMNLEQAVDMCSILTQAHYNGFYYEDIKDENLLYCSDGRVGIIDTESRGFFSESPRDGMNKLVGWYARKSCPAQTFLRQKLEEIENK